MLEARRFISGAEGHGVAPELAMPPQRQALSSPVKPRYTPAREKKEKADILALRLPGQDVGHGFGGLVWTKVGWDDGEARRSL